MNRAGQALHGVFFVLAAVACFAALDTGTKFVGAVVPVWVFVWTRYTFQAAVTAATLLPSRGRALLRTRHPGLQVLRGALLLTTSVGSFLSLKYTPVGEFTAIVMLAPLLVAVLAATSLGEPISPARWLLSLGGFAGALIVIRPGSEGFEWTMLLPLALVMLLTAFQLLTRRLAQLEDAATTHFYTGLVGALAASAVLPFGWQSPGHWTVWAALLMLAAFGSVGHFLLILGYARASVATLTPYLYAQVAFAALAGWIVFAHVPDGWSLAGILLITTCGAVGTWLTAREQRGAVTPAVTAPSPLAARPAR